MTDGIDAGNYGYGFYGFKARLDALIAAFGGTPNVRICISETFQWSLRNEQQNAKARNDYSRFSWTDAKDKDFDYAGWRIESMWRRKPEAPVLAVATWENMELQLRQGAVHAHVDGSWCGWSASEPPGYWMQIARVMESESYSWREQANVPKWSPYLTDEGCYLAKGSKYSGEAKSTNAKSAEGAQASLRKLVEKFFKVQFVDVKAVAA